MPRHSSLSRSRKASALGRKRRKKRSPHPCKGFLEPMPVIEEPKRHYLSSEKPTVKPCCDAIEPLFIAPSSAIVTASMETQGQQDCSARDIVIANLQRVLLSGFATNSSDKRLLAARLSVGLIRAAASAILEISPKTIQRGDLVLLENPDALLGQQQPKQKRQRMQPQRHQAAIALLDTIAPVQSGHQWRVIRCTEDNLYKTYVIQLAADHPSQKPVCKSYFLQHVLDKKKNLVHHESSPDFCPHCKKRTELLEKQKLGPLSEDDTAELQDLEQHFQLKTTQWNVYHQVMSQLEKNHGLRLIVQDFNKQETNALEMQVLSIVLYEASVGWINTHYFHYLLPPATANDVLAVVACHRLFFQEPLIKNATELSFWSDGGPKRFKLTANLAHMWAFAASVSIPITLHFFLPLIMEVGPLMQLHLIFPGLSRMRQETFNGLEMISYKLWQNSEQSQILRQL